MYSREDIKWIYFQHPQLMSLFHCVLVMGEVDLVPTGCIVMPLNVACYYYDVIIRIQLLLRLEPTALTLTLATALTLTLATALTLTLATTFALQP